jgi:hypothetical protein
MALMLVDEKGPMAISGTRCGTAALAVTSDNGSSRKFDHGPKVPPAAVPRVAPKRATVHDAMKLGPLDTVPTRQWQDVLKHVELAMQTEGVLMPEGWQAALARQVGRDDA